MADGDRAKAYLVECYWPGVTQERVATTVERVQAAASALRRQGGQATFMGSILVPADEAVFCLFEGVEADVRAASQAAGLSFERVVEALRMDGTDREEE